MRVFFSCESAMRIRRRIRSRQYHRIPHGGGVSGITAADDKTYPISRIQNAVQVEAFPFRVNAKPAVFSSSRCAAKTPGESKSREAKPVDDERESQVKSDGAQERTRTSTTLRPLAPEASASASSATWAQVFPEKRFATTGKKRGSLIVRAVKFFVNERCRGPLLATGHFAGTCEASMA